MHTPAMPPPTPQRNQHRPPATAAHHRPLPAPDSTPSSAPVQLADLQSILSNVVGSHAVQAAAPQPSKLTGIFGTREQCRVCARYRFPFYACNDVLQPCTCHTCSHRTLAVLRNVRKLSRQLKNTRRNLHRICRPWKDRRRRLARTMCVMSFATHSPVHSFNK